MSTLVKRTQRCLFQENLLFLNNHSCYVIDIIAALSFMTDIERRGLGRASERFVGGDEGLRTSCPGARPGSQGSSV